ncbi:MAG: pilin [Candidatus Pacebacteria bacterium]|nr:pilin [Candidatus Paceibacterota bacterium]
MKKLLSIFAVVSLLTVLILPAVSLAQQPPDSLPNKCTMSADVGMGKACPASGSDCIEGSCGPNGKWGICCMLNTIYVVTNWVFYIMTLVAVLMIVYGGFVYVTAAGDPAKAGSGKSILTFAIIGLAIALIAKLIPSLVKFIIGV